MKSVHAFITGGAGFIGSFLVDRLLQENCAVTIFDRYTREKATAIARHDNRNCLRIIWGDVANAAEVRAALTCGVDWVFHLSGKGNIAPSLVQPIPFHQVHVSGTLHVLEAARQAGATRFLYAGSSSCYGNTTSFPTSETEPIRLDHPYAVTKYVGEQYALAWAKIYKLPVISLRLFNVYGPRSRTARTYGPVVSAFMAQKLAGQPFTVVGDGRQTRDFIFVTDVVSAFLAAAQSSISGEVFNVGTGIPHSINDLVAALGGTTTPIPRRPGEPMQSSADISKIRRMLNWSPIISFEQGMQAVLERKSLWKHAPVWTPARIRKATDPLFRYLKEPT